MVKRITDYKNVIVIYKNRFIIAQLCLSVTAKGIYTEDEINANPRHNTYNRQHTKSTSFWSRKGKSLVGYWKNKTARVPQQDNGRSKLCKAKTAIKSIGTDATPSQD